MDGIRPILVFICLLGFVLWQPIQAHPPRIDLKNTNSLQRGARLYMNYCSGCHSLRYLRFNHMAKGLGLTTFDGRIDEGLLKNNLIFTKAAPYDPIRIALPSEDAKQWFGTVPPDLSLIARAKGTEWLYNYLGGFYPDETRPFGTNNWLVPDVAMPNIMATMSEDLPKNQLAANLQDLVTFLAFVSTPEQKERYHLGYFVLGFLFILFLFALSLKTVYWRKIGIN